MKDKNCPKPYSNQKCRDCPHFADTCDGDDEDVV